MAGIGFELQKLLKRNSILTAVQAFIYGSAVSSGPMLLTVLTVGILSWMSRRVIDAGAVSLLTLTVTYTFALSLLLTAPLQNLLTRFIADKHFSKKPGEYYAGFLTSTSLVLLLALLVAMPLYITLEIYVPVKHTTFFRTLGVIAFVGQCLIWQLMAFISTSKEYNKILWAFLIGALFSLGAAAFAVPRLGVTGALAGFTAGQWLTALIILHIVTGELDIRRRWSREYFTTFRTYPLLALTGFFYTLGIWIDKFVLYATVGNNRLASHFYSFADYDIPNFFALLSLVPGLAYFLIAAETHFYEHFRKFVHSIVAEPQIRIERDKQEMLSSLVRGLRGMIRVQGLVTLILIILARPVMVYFRFAALSPWIFRLLLIAAFFHLLAYHLNIFLLYLEQRRQAMWLSMLFVTLNGGLTYAATRLGPQYYAMGFFISAAVTAAVSWPILHRAVREIDFRIFSSQPIAYAAPTTKALVRRRPKAKSSRRPGRAPLSGTIKPRIR